MLCRMCKCRFISSSLRFQHTASTTAEQNNLRKLLPWTPRDPGELVSFLKRSVLFHVPGQMVVLEKPFGITCFGYHLAGRLFKNRQAREDLGLEESEAKAMSIESVLPQLAFELEEKQLMVGKAMPRYVSGAVILVTNDGMLNHLRKSMGRVTRGVTACANMKAHAICVGTPLEDQREVSGTVGAKYVSVRGKTVAVETDEIPSNRNKRMGAIKQMQANYRVLGSNRQCSLVELNFNKFSRHLARIFLTINLLPVLGDSIYQQRIARVMDTPVLIPVNNASITNQFVPPELLKALYLSPEQYHKLPLCFHVSELRLIRLFRKTEDIIINIEPPLHFMRILRGIELEKCLIDTDLVTV